MYFNTFVRYTCSYNEIFYHHERWGVDIYMMMPIKNETSECIKMFAECIT